MPRKKNEKEEKTHRKNRLIVRAKAREMEKERERKSERERERERERAREITTIRAYT
jgi:hypothetical protein